MDVRSEAQIRKYNKIANAKSFFLSSGRLVRLEEKKKRLSIRNKAPCDVSLDPEAWRQKLSDYNRSIKIDLIFVKSYCILWQIY